MHNESQTSEKRVMYLRKFVGHAVRFYFQFDYFSF